MIQVLPFFSELKRKYPLSEIYVLCAVQTAFLFDREKSVKKIFTFKNSWFYKEKKVNLKEILSIIRLLRKEKN